MIRFWEGSRSPSGSCGSRNFLKKDNFKTLWTDFDEILRKCPKWDKEHLMVGFECLGTELSCWRSVLSECSCSSSFNFFLIIHIDNTKGPLNCLW